MVWLPGIGAPRYVFALFCERMKIYVEVYDGVDGVGSSLRALGSS